VLGGHGEPAVLRLAGRRHHALGELGLKHQHERLSLGEQAEGDLRGDAVREVRDAGGKIGKVDVERVALDHVEEAVVDRGRELLAEEVCEGAVALDHGEVAGRGSGVGVSGRRDRRQQPVGERTRAPADL